MEKIELSWWACMPFELKWYKIVIHKALFDSYPDVKIEDITEKQIKQMYMTDVLLKQNPKLAIIWQLK